MRSHKPLLGLAMFLAIFPRACSCALAAESQSTPAPPRLIPKPDAFQTLVNPDCSHCRDEAKRRAGQLRDDDRVLAWIRGKYEGGAIPIRFYLNPYRVISDTYGVFVYDPDAGFTRGYEPSLDFRFHGWRGGVMVMRHKDGTLFSTLSGRAFAGPRKGEQLKPVPTLETDWGYFNSAYPGAVAYKMYDKYQPISLPTALTPESLASRAPADPRLPADTPVIGLALGDHARAYPIDDLEESGFITDRLGDQRLVVLYFAPTRTAAIYAPEIDGHSPATRVTLSVPAISPTASSRAREQADDNPPERSTLNVQRSTFPAPFVDRETSSTWSIEGRALSGPLKGKTLRWLPAVQCRWAAWAAEYPNTTIYSTD